MKYNKQTLKSFEGKIVRMNYFTKFHENSVVGKIEALANENMIFNIQENERMIAYEKIKKVMKLENKKLKND